MDVIPQWPDGVPGIQLDLLAAEKAWEQVLLRDPDDGLAHANLALVLVAQGQGSRAREHLGKALRLAPMEPRVHFVRSFVRLDEVRMVEIPILGTGCNDPWAVRCAIRDIRQALALAPDEASFWHRLGELYSLLGQWRRVLPATERALQLDPGHVPAVVLRSQALVHDGRVPEAEVVLRRALSGEPESAGLQAELGWVLLGRGSDAEAAGVFRESLRCDPLGDRAQMGLLECGKRRFRVYRWLATARIRLERFPLWIRALLLVASFATAVGIIHRLSEWAKAWPEYRWVPLVGFGLFLSVVLFLMLADAVFGSLARRYPEGQSTRAQVEGQADRLQLGMIGLALGGAALAIMSRKLGREIQFGVLSLTPGLYCLWITSRIPQPGGRLFGWAYSGLLLLSAIPIALFLEARFARMPGWAVLACLVGPVLPLALLEEVGRRRALAMLRRQIKSQL